MIEHVRLSEKAKQQLIAIKRKTGIENWNVLCRWALCLSLAEESIPPFEDIQTDSAVEMSWKTFSGEYSHLFNAILLERFINEYSASTEENGKELEQFIKLHIHRGISFLSKKSETIDHLYINIINYKANHS